MRNFTLLIILIFLAQLSGFAALPESVLMDSVQVQVRRAVQGSVGGGIAPAGVPGLPTPQAAGLMRQAVAQPHLYTGTPMVQVPLHTLSAKGISVPVALYYSTKGVRVDELEGVVGTSWQLQAGGAVTRVMRGYPDEVSTSATETMTRIPHENMRWVLERMIEEGADFNWWARTFYKKRIKEAVSAGRDAEFDRLKENNKKTQKKIEGLWHSYNTVRQAGESEAAFDKITGLWEYDEDKGEVETLYDTEPDKFYVSAPGLGGISFYIHPERQEAIIHADQELSITMDKRGKSIAGFTVVTTAGTHYVFGMDSSLTEEQQITVEGHSVVSGNNRKDDKAYNTLSRVNLEALSVMELPRYTSCWYLKEIITPLKQDTVHFSYHSIGDLSYTQSRQLNGGMDKVFDHATLEDGLIKVKKAPETKYYLSQNYSLTRSHVRHFKRKRLYKISSSLQRVRFEYEAKTSTDAKNKLSKVWVSSRGQSIKGYDLAYREVETMDDPDRTLNVGTAYYWVLLFNAYGYKTITTSRKPHPKATIRHDGEGYSVVAAMLMPSVSLEVNKLTLPSSFKTRSFLSGITELSSTGKDSIRIFDFDYHRPGHLPQPCSWHQNYYGYYQEVNSLKGLMQDCGAEGFQNSFFKNYLSLSNRNTANSPQLSTIGHGMLSGMTNAMGGHTRYYYSPQPWGNRLDSAVSTDGKREVSRISYRYERESVPTGVSRRGVVQGDMVSFFPKGNAEQMMTQGAAVGYGKVTAYAATGKEEYHYTTAKDYDNEGGKKIEKIEVTRPCLRVVIETEEDYGQSSPTVATYAFYYSPCDFIDFLQEKLPLREAVLKDRLLAYKAEVECLNPQYGAPTKDEVEAQLRQVEQDFEKIISLLRAEGYADIPMSGPQAYRYRLEYKQGVRPITTGETATAGRINDYDNLRGKLTKHQVYSLGQDDKTHHLVSCRSTTYEKKCLVRGGYSPVAVTTGSTSLREFNKGLAQYDLHHYILRPVKTTETAYISANDAMTTVKEHYYASDRDGDYNLLLPDSTVVRNLNTGDVIANVMQIERIGAEVPQKGTFTSIMRPVAEARYLNGQLMEAAKIDYYTIHPERPKTFSQWEQATDSYTPVLHYDRYDAAGHLLQMHGRSGIYESVYYNQNGLPEMTAAGCTYADLTAAIDKGGDVLDHLPADVSLSQVRYDDFGRMINKGGSLPGVSMAYAYDAFGRLTYIFEQITRGPNNIERNGIAAYHYRYGNATATTVENSDFTLENMVIGESFQIDGYTESHTTPHSNLGINAVRQYSYKQPGITYATRYTEDPAKAAVSVRYQDGLGRSVQQISRAALPGGQSIVQGVEYDERGRSSTAYLPYIGSSTLAYMADWKARLAQSYGNDSLQYSRTTAYGDYGGVNAHGGYGAAYQLKPEGTPDEEKHYSETSSRLNAAPWQSYTVDDRNSLILKTHAPKTIAVNEQRAEGVVMREYKDSYGRVLCKATETLDGSEALMRTYYVYDDYNNLLAIIPPKATEKGSRDYLSADYVYRYHYDARHRLWRKDIPGSGAIYVAYDELDRPVMEQDACGTLTYLRYDRLGRATESGQITAAPGFDLKNSYNHNFELSFAEKTVTIAEKSLTDKGAAYAFVTAEVPVLWLSRRRYDDYGADFALGQKHHNGSYLKRLPGAATGSKTRILGSKGDDAACYIETATYYDERGRAIHTVSTNPMGGADHTLSTYNWNGSLSEQRIEKAAGAAGRVTVVKRFDYYHSGDLRRVLHGINPQKESDYTELARLSYDERGRLSTKHLHNGTMEEHYHYDVFDRLIGKRAVKINHTYSPTAVWNDEMAAYDTVYVPTPPDALFALSLAYDDVSQIAVPEAVPRYDGNISAISWQNRQETQEYYRLDYNKLGSLTAAHSRNQAYDAAYRYDAHGNIEGLLRTTEWGDTLHHFDYHYRGNQLDSLTRRQVMTYTMRPGDMNRDGRVYTDDNIYWGGIDTLVSENERLPRREQGTAWKDYTFQLHKTQDETPYYLDANGDGIIDTLDAHAIKEHIGQYYEQIPARQGATYGYRYDESGNMIEDAYKNLKITYNSLNLPDTMTIAGRGQVVNTYLADGTLLKRAYYNAADSLVRQTDYGGMFLYENGSLDKIFTDEGYVSIENGKLRIENFTYNYVLTDHLGHTRSVVSSEGTVLQEHAYYPYGMAIGHLSMRGDYGYLYTGKEHLAYGGLNWYDHGSRYFDSELGIWRSIDPALQYSSPYVAMGNNPVMYVDEDGELAWFVPIIIGAAINAITYSSQALAFETWNAGEFFKSVGIGALQGAISYGASFIGTSVFALDLLIDAGLSVGTNGLFNLMGGQDFFEGWQTTVITSAVTTTLTSENLKNVGEGKGFKNNRKVFEDFRRGKYTINGGVWQQDFIDYMGVKNAKYIGGDGQSHFWFSNKNPNNYGINYTKGAFYSYSDFKNVTTKELFHYKRYANRGYAAFETGSSGVRGFDLMPEERLGVIHQYKNQGFTRSLYNYLKGIENTENLLTAYSNPNSPLWAYTAPYQFTPYTEKWWHFIYKIPRRR